MEQQKVHMGIVGLTSDHVWQMGDGLAALPEVALVAAAEPYPELCARATQQWRLGRTYPDYRAMLDGEALDAILVCGDNAGKAEIAEAAAERGIHVYQDKPMAATLAQADRILAAAERSGIVLMVAYHIAFHPVYDQIKQLLDVGAIGRPYLARGIIGHGGPIEYGCSRYFCEWLFDKERNGGGSFVDEACYLIDLFLYLLGPITEVSAFTAQIGHRDYLPADVEDNAVAILRFASGALGLVDAKWGQVGPAPLFSSFHGTRGTIINGRAGTELYSTVDGAAPADWMPLDVAAAASEGHGEAGGRGWRAPDMTHPVFSRREQRTFVDGVLNRRSIVGPSSPQIARDTQEVIEAVYRSAATGRSVQVPLP